MNNFVDRFLGNEEFDLRDFLLERSDGRFEIGKRISGYAHSLPATSTSKLLIAAQSRKGLMRRFAAGGTGNV